MRGFFFKFYFLYYCFSNENKKYKEVWRYFLSVIISKILEQIPQRIKKIISYNIQMQHVKHWELHCTDIVWKQGVLEECLLFAKYRPLLKNKQTNFNLSKYYSKDNYRKAAFLNLQSVILKLIEFTCFELVENKDSLLEMLALLNILLLDICITHSLRIWD